MKVKVERDHRPDRQRWPFLVSYFDGDRWRLYHIYDSLKRAQKAARKLEDVPVPLPAEVVYEGGT